MAPDCLYFHDVIINFTNVVTVRIECVKDEPEKCRLHLVTKHDATYVPLDVSYERALADWRAHFGVEMVP